MRNEERRGGKSRLLVVPVALLAIGGLWLAALAGAEDQPTVRAGGYPPSTCDEPGQSLDTKITKAPKGKTKSTKAKIEFIGFYCNNSDLDVDQGDCHFRVQPRWQEAEELRLAGQLQGAEEGQAQPQREGNGIHVQPGWLWRRPHPCGGQVEDQGLI